MRVSVALATHNGEKFIGRQLQSLSSQTRPPDEIVVADDSSSDRTIEIVRAFFAGTGIDGVILRNESGRKLRPPKNFERAILQCTGDLVFCCDQDDEWDPSKLEKVCAVFESRPDLACFLSNARFCDSELKPTGSDKLGQIRSAGLPDESFVMGCCAAFRKRFLDIALPIPREITHDGWLVGLADLLQLSDRSNTILQSYRIHQGNVSKSFFINSSGTSGRVSLMLSKLSATITSYSSNEALHRELVYSSAVEERLASNAEQILASFPASALESALTQIRLTKARLGFRRTIREAPAIKRLSMIRDGFKLDHYRGIAGIFHALKDLFISMRSAEEFRLWPS